jgi:hypothetical protein
MKKRLLFAFVAMCMVVSSFALTKGEFVYTPQGRFQITGDNINTNSAFKDLTGWTVISASEEKTLDDNIIVKSDGFASGLNSIASNDQTNTEGMYFKFEPTSPNDTYVVSFKMKGPALTTTRTYTIAWDGSGAEVGDQLLNCVKVKGNSAHKYQQEDGLENEIIVNDGGEELTEEWQTFSYAIVGDGTNRTYFIELRGLAADVEFADLQIAPAMQFADLRQRDAMLEKLNAYKNCYEWPADILEEVGINEAVANLQAIGDASSQDALNDLLPSAQDILNEFLKANMDDYLDGNDANYLGVKTSDGNTNKVSKIGDWNCIPGGRGHWSNGANPDMGHYQNSSSWAYSNVDDPMGVTLQKKLLTGSYVFYIESNAAVREAYKQTWNIDRGMKPAYGVAYIAKTVDGAATDTIAKVVLGLDPVKFTPFIISAKVEEDGVYEFGMLGYCKDEYKNLKLGSVVVVKDAAIWGKNTSPYSLKQLNYEDDVREQITTGRDNLTTAAANIADGNNYWGKTALQAVVDEVTPLIEKYEAMSQEAIIATFDEDVYVKAERTSNAESGLLVYEVYDTATKLIIAANREFAAKNDTLNSIQKTIDNAQTVLYMRVYDTATGKDALKDAINKAKDFQAQMKASDYSEENAAAVLTANAELNAAVEIFKATLPASSIATLADIDFENEPELDFDTFLYTITGAKGSMLFSAFIAQTAEGDCSFEKGFWSNGEQLWKGYLRVGNGDGTVTFDPKPEGAADMGTNILRFSFDYYIQGLTDRYLGFFLKGLKTVELDGEPTEEDTEFAGFYLDAYKSVFQTNTFNVALENVSMVSGATYNNVSPVDAENPTDNTLPKTSFEVILDYGAKQMYCSTTTANGSATTVPVELDGTIPTSFILRSNYSVDSRRAWFDNLKIERVTAGAYDPSGIESVKATAKAGNDAIYNLAGQKVGKDYKGLVIKNGKKQIQK